MLNRLGSAFYDTFRELWNLEDPNAIRPWQGGERRGVKTKRVLANVFKPTQPNAQERQLPTTKPPLAPTKPQIRSVDVVIKRDHIKPSTKATKTAKMEMAKLEQSGKEDPFTEDPRTWNQEIPREDDTAAKRLKEPKSTRKTTHDILTPARRRFLFLRLGDEAILRYAAGGAPPWTNLYPTQLSRNNGRGYFEGLPILLKDEKRKLVKKTYFDPGKPTSQYAIHDHLLKEAANLTRRDVVSALHKLEVYQRLRQRQLPHKITGRTEYFSPGYFAADTIYPGQKWGGWPKTVIFTVVDAWSRYCGAYVVSDKQKGTIGKAFKLYLDSYNTFASAPPKKLMIDRGSELRELDSIMETYSQKRPCVFRSLTGQPVNLIEGFNAQLQRMCQVYKEAGIVSDFEDVLYLVVNAINNQARKDRMGFTPVELLQMNQPMRQQVNENYKFRNQMPAERGPLEVGQYARVIMLNRKEQVDTKTKGFPAHWSKDVFVITRRTAVIKNPGVYKYWLESTTTGAMVEGSRFRHELLAPRHRQESCETGPQRQT